MNRAGKPGQLHPDALINRNLRQRACLLSLFAVFLVGIDFLPFFQSSLAPSFTAMFGQPVETGPRSKIDAESITNELPIPFHVSDSSANLLNVPDSCNAQPHWAPFLGLPMDINRAQEADLTLLPGIGPVLARRIVAEWAAGGQYQNTKDLLRVNGIGPSTLAHLQPHLCTR